MQNINEAPQWLQEILTKQSEAIVSLTDRVGLKESQGKPDGGNDPKPETDAIKDWAKNREEEEKAWKRK